MLAVEFPSPCDGTEYWNLALRLRGVDTEHRMGRGRDLTHELGKSLLRFATATAGS
jgi:hypothetical protein